MSSGTSRSYEISSEGKEGNAGAGEEISQR